MLADFAKEVGGRDASLPGAVGFSKTIDGVFVAAEERRKLDRLEAFVCPDPQAESHTSDDYKAAAHPFHRGFPSVEAALVRAYHIPADNLNPALLLNDLVVRRSPLRRGHCPDLQRVLNLARLDQQ